MNLHRLVGRGAFASASAAMLALAALAGSRDMRAHATATEFPTTRRSLAQAPVMDPPHGSAPTPTGGDAARDKLHEKMFYSCPTHTDVHESVEGSCASCGALLVPVRPTARGGAGEPSKD